MTKAWYKSKQILLNVFSILALILALPELAAVIDPDWMKWVLLVNAVGNGLLRFDRVKPVGWTDGTGNGYDDGNGAV